MDVQPDLGLVELLDAVYPELVGAELEAHGRGVPVYGFRPTTSRYKRTESSPQMGREFHGDVAFPIEPDGGTITR
jgi:hypothetical protein